MKIGMDLTNPSYAQSLRAIGQSLEVLCVERFELQNDGTDYLVKTEANFPATESVSQKRFLESLVEKIWGSPIPSPKPSRSSFTKEYLCYTPSDVLELEKKGEAKRGESNTMPDAHKLPQVLRVIGDYLDRRHAGTFNIALANQAVSLIYRTFDGRREREEFTVDNLYDLGVHMYLRRAGRES